MFYGLKNKCKITSISAMSSSKIAYENISEKHQVEDFFCTNQKNDGCILRYIFHPSFSHYCGILFTPPITVNGAHRTGCKLLHVVLYCSTTIIISGSLLFPSIEENRDRLWQFVLSSRNFNRNFVF